MKLSNTLKDQFKLHFIVFIWGFTGVIGEFLKPMSAISITFYRTMICAIFFYAYLQLKKPDKIHLPRRIQIRLLLIGGLIGTHWVAFFLGIHVSNISTALVGVATGSLWTAILEPLMLKKRIRAYEILLGAFIILGIFIITNSKGVNPFGLYLGVIAALLTAYFSILNVSSISQVQNAVLVTKYEMVGALLAVLIISPFLHFFFDIPLSFTVTKQQAIFLFVLSILCTVYPFVASIELLKRVSAYSINLATNLEPVYAIVLAFLIFKENEAMHKQFFFGATIILSAVMLDPILKGFEKRKSIRRKPIS